MKIYVQTYGCAFNKRDSEYIKGILEVEHKLVDSPETADCIIVNSCSVKDVTQSKVFSFIDKHKDKKIVLGGCLVRSVDVDKYTDNVDLMFDTNSIKDLPDLLREEADKFDETKEKKLGVPLVRHEKDIAIVPISEGCLGNCYFCSTKLARGKLKSYPIDDIVREVKGAVDDGCKKIFLTSQDNGCFGFDNGESLHSLLKEVCSLEGDFIVRNGMANPNHIKKFVKQLVEAYKDDKVMKFLHVPVQSGSNKVLKEMNRKHTVEDFVVIVEEFRKEFPEISISTDIIVGYPTETEEDFEKTVKLVEEVKPEVLNISKFAARPNTKAFRMKKLASEVVKERSVRLSKVYKGLF